MIMQAVNINYYNNFVPQPYDKSPGNNILSGIPDKA